MDRDLDLDLVPLVAVVEEAVLLPLLLLLLLLEGNELRLLRSFLWFQFPACCMGDIVTVDENDDDNAASSLMPLLLPLFPVEDEPIFRPAARSMSMNAEAEAEAASPLPNRCIRLVFLSDAFCFRNCLKLS